MNVLSLFDGISAGMVALKRAGICVENYYASEIDKYAIEISKKNYPEIVQLGDVTNLDCSQLGEIDLLIGGSPCQSFSVAGKQEGFNGKSGLFWEYVRVLRQIKPKYFLFENVKMKKEWRDVISEALGVDPVEINSSLVSAQNRTRLYWSNIPNITQPTDKGILLADILDNGIALQDKSQTVLATIHKENAKSMCTRGKFGLLVETVDREKAYCLDANYWKGTNVEQYLQKKRRQIVYTENGFRKLSPTECERLQTFSYGYTEGISNTQRYKALGNSWTVDVIAHIFKEIK